DLLVMQDPEDSSTFHIGHWGIDRSSTNWAAFTPDRGYLEPIVADPLDELNGTLHTLHEGSSNFYILSWDLLTGRVVRIETSLAAGGSVPGFMYSSDMDSFIILTESTGRLHLIDATTGDRFHNTGRLSAYIGDA